MKVKKPTTCLCPSTISSLPGSTLVHRSRPDSGESCALHKAWRWQYLIFAISIFQYFDIQIFQYSNLKVSRVHCTEPEDGDQRTCTADGCLGSCSTTGYCNKVTSTPVPYIVWYIQYHTISKVSWHCSTTGYCYKVTSAPVPYSVMPDVLIAQLQ